MTNLPEHIPRFLHGVYDPNDHAGLQAIASAFREIQDDELRQQQDAQDDPTGEHPYSWSIAQEQENSEKNRYTDILPYNRTRVLLEPIRDPTTGDTILGDYVNASWVEAPGGIRKYIATQGPLPKTLVDFWRMVWQEKVRVIVMLTDTFENGKVKCHTYWPEKTDQQLNFETAGLEVRLLAEEKALNGVAMIRRFEVTKRPPRLPERPTISQESGSIVSPMRDCEETPRRVLPSPLPLSTRGEALMSQRRAAHATPIALNSSFPTSNTQPLTNKPSGNESVGKSGVPLNGPPQRHLPHSAIPHSMAGSLQQPATPGPGNARMGSAPTAPPPNFMLARPPRKPKNSLSLGALRGGNVTEAPRTSTGLVFRHAEDPVRLPGKTVLEESTHPLPTKPIRTTPVETKTANTKTTETKTTEAKTTEAKTTEAKTTEAKTVEAKTASKAESKRPESPAKSWLPKHSSKSTTSHSPASSTASKESSRKFFGNKSDSDSDRVKHLFRGISDWFQWVTRVKDQDCIAETTPVTDDTEPSEPSTAPTMVMAVEEPPKPVEHLESSPLSPAATTATTVDTTSNNTTNATLNAASDTTSDAASNTATFDAASNTASDTASDATSNTTATSAAPSFPLPDKSHVNSEKRYSCPAPASAPLPARSLSFSPNYEPPPVSASIRDPKSDGNMLSPMVMPESELPPPPRIKKPVTPSPLGEEILGHEPEVQKAIITQIHFLGWPDHGAPKAPDDLLRLVRLVNREQGGTDTPGPVVVHCSAGCGRTGTYCVIDSAIAILMATRDGSVDLVQQLTKHFRSQRTTMVQTSQQYIFCYRAILRRLQTVLQRGRSMTL